MSTTHRELFVKFLEADEEDLLEGKREVMGDLRKTERRRIAAEEEVQGELLAGGDAGDERAAVARKRGRDHIVRLRGVLGQRIKRRSGRRNGAHGRRIRDRRDKAQHQLGGLPRLARRKEIAQLRAMRTRTRRILVAAHDQIVYCQPDPGNRFLHHQLVIPFR